MGVPPDALGLSALIRKGGGDGARTCQDGLQSLEEPEERRLKVLVSHTVEAQLEDHRLPAGT